MSFETRLSQAKKVVDKRWEELVYNTDWNSHCSKHHLFCCDILVFINNVDSGSSSEIITFLLKRHDTEENIWCLLKTKCKPRMWPKVELSLVPDFLPEILSFFSWNYFHKNITKNILQLRFWQKFIEMTTFLTWVARFPKNIQPKEIQPRSEKKNESVKWHHDFATKKKHSQR